MTWFSSLGAASARWHRRVLQLWVGIVLLALWQGSYLEARVTPSGGLRAGSGAGRVEQRLREAFDSPFSQILLVVVAPVGVAPARPVSTLTDRLTTFLQRQPRVTAVLPVPGSDAQRLAFVIGLDTPSLPATGHLVPGLRAGLAHVVRPATGYRAQVTGEAALERDLVAKATSETRAAELRVLPVTLLALLVAFGAIGAAMAPLIAGAGAVILAIGCLSLLATVLPLATFSANVASMLGLGLGIDYALFIVARIREEESLGAPTPFAAVTAAIRHAAPAIAVSAATVLIGLAALMTIPAHDTFGLGLGGAVVAATSALSGLTLLPAMAAWLGAWLDAPKRLSRRLHGHAQIVRWEGRAARILQRPVLALCGAVGILVVLAAPAGRIRLGDPDVAMMPPSMESIQAIKTLEAMGAKGVMMPFRLLVTMPPGEPVLSVARISGLANMTAFLRQDPRVAQVVALADPANGAEQLVTGLAMAGSEVVRRQLPPQAKTLLSHDGRATVVHVVLRNTVSYLDARALSWELQKVAWGQIPGLDGVEVLVGGLVAANTDYIDMVRHSIPPVMAIVLVSTLAMLFAMTRSVLIPVKAVLANLLTVGAALGGTAWMFQNPVTCRWLGLAQPIGEFAPGIPILVFCVVFGLSMDYEVFLISRIQEAHLAGKADREAIIYGIGRSGSVITSAAIIMGIVFLGFALTELLPVKMLGIALALGVILDATVTRLLLIPSLMMIAGRWNWWPGRPTAADPGSIGSDDLADQET